MLAEHLQGADGEPLLVTAESTGDGTYSLVFRVHDEYYLMHAAADGTAELVDSNFQFSGLVGAWHAVAPIAPHSSVDTPASHQAPPEALQPIPVPTPAVPEARTPTIEPPPAEVRLPEFKPVAPPAIEIIQALISTPEFEPAIAAATNRSRIYFFNHAATETRASRHRSFDEAFRQTSGDTADSHLLLLSMLGSRSHTDSEAFLFHGSNRSHSDDSSSELSDIDAAFESIVPSQVARNAHRHSVVGA
jgi:hypothetical protein